MTASCKIRTYQVRGGEGGREGEGERVQQKSSLGQRKLIGDDHEDCDGDLALISDVTPLTALWETGHISGNGFGYNNFV